MEDASLISHYSADNATAEAWNSSRFLIASDSQKTTQLGRKAKVHVD